MAMIAGSAASAHATPPPMRCFFLPSHAWGYDDGELSAGLFADESECASYDSPDRFPLRATLSGLVQLDVGTDESGFARAQLEGAVDVLHHLRLVMGGDAAEGAVLDAYAKLMLGGLSLAAGRMVVPFALEQQWSDGNLPFLERSATIQMLAPPLRADGVSLALTTGRKLATADDRSDTLNDVALHAEIGVFWPTEDSLDAPVADDRDVVARAFVRRDRNNDYKSLDSYLEVGASAAVGRGPDGARRRYALEADARFYRYRASAELFTASLETMSGPLDGTGGTLTLSATVPVDRERWWTSPLPRYPLPTTRFVSPSETDAANPGIELDLGVDTVRESTRSFAAVRAAAHAFLHDFAKVSVAYKYTRGWGLLPAHQHETTLRLQLAF